MGHTASWWADTTGRIETNCRVFDCLCESTPTVPHPLSYTTLDSVRLPPPGFFLPRDMKG